MAAISTTRRVLLVASALMLGACADAPTANTPPVPDAGMARSQQAQDRLEALFHKASPEVLALPGTVFADNDERIGRLVFGIEHKGAAHAVKAALTRLGIPESDYAIEVTPAIYQVATLRDKFRPTIAGIQIHFTQYACTMGFNVDVPNGTSTPDRSFITNSHCTATQGGTEGTKYYQPLSTVDPTVIATEVDDPPYSRGGGCPKGKRCRRSDASRALYSAGVASNRGEIAQTTGVNNGSLTLSSTNPVFTITSQDDDSDRFITPQPGGITLFVSKVGRTTGWTRGKVVRTCVDTGVQGTQILQLCQSWVSDPGGATVVGSGDSGSPVFVESGNNAELVGILWGGSSDNKLYVFSPLKNIHDDLGAFTATR